MDASHQDPTGGEDHGSLAEAILFPMGNDFVTDTVLHVEGGHRLMAP